MKRPRIFVLVFLCFIVGAFTAQTKTVETADLALINGRVWLGGDSSNFAEAVAVKGNYISQVGSNVEIKKQVDEHTQVIDLGGRLVAPGFNDAHIHFLNGSLGLNEVDLTESRSVAEMIERIAAYAKKNPQAVWITGRGWEYSKFPGGLPTKTYLDAIIKDRPIFLSAYDGHSAWVNSKALALANVTRETRFDGYGEVVKDAAGEPTGALKEGAQSLVRRLLPVATREQKLDAIRAGMKLAAALGITSIQNASGSPDEFSLYEELLRRSELTLRVAVAFPVGERTRPEDLERYLAIKNQNDLNPMLKAGSVKFMLDGVIESHTAAMLQQYSDLPPNHGMPLGELTMPSDVYRDLVARIDKLGFQIYTHAIGDRAVREALNAYEFAQKANGRKNTRHRIEHIETISPEDIPRLASLKVLPSMEPIHADPGTAEVWSKAVGAERLPYAFPWAALLRSGAHLVFSSDWPAAISVDPIRGLHSAVNRRTVDGQPPRGWIPEQRISVADALRAYTHGGAYSSYEEGVKGNLAANQLADIVVFSQDLFKIDPMKIHETKVVLTIFNGKAIYSKL